MSLSKHDPGGKKVLPMLPGVRGDAYFHGENACYRTELRRWWGRGGFEHHDHVLWIGMNPSTARADVDDPTIRREIFFSERFRVTSYKKMNVMDYRATHPKDLMDKLVTPCSPENLEALRQALQSANHIVVAWGKLPLKLEQHSQAVAAMIKRLRVAQPYCLGTTSEGHPRHPLYVDGQTPFQPWFPNL